MDRVHSGCGPDRIGHEGTFGDFHLEVVWGYPVMSEFVLDMADNVVGVEVPRADVHRYPGRGSGGAPCGELCRGPGDNPGGDGAHERRWFDDVEDEARWDGALNRVVPTQQGLDRTEP